MKYTYDFHINGEDIAAGDLLQPNNTSEYMFYYSESPEPNPNNFLGFDKMIQVEPDMMVLYLGYSTCQNSPEWMHRSLLPFNIEFEFLYRGEKWAMYFCEYKIYDSMNSNVFDKSKIFNMSYYLKHADTLK